MFLADDVGISVSMNLKNMKKNICGIYKFTNRINGKSYVGQSTSCWRRRTFHITNSKHPKSCEYNTYFHKALRKYGADSFDFEILEECSKDMLNEREMYWIEYYKTFENGYNQTRGGDCAEHMEKPVYQIDIETKNVIKEFPSLKDASEYIGCSLSSISQTCTGKWGYAHGYLWSFKENYSKEKYADYKQKKQFKEVYSIDKVTHKIVKKYNSIISASNDVKGMPSTITLNCKGQIKSCFGFIWCYAKDYYDGKYDGYILNEQMKGVLKIDPDTDEVVGEYATLKEASISMGRTNKTNIALACQGRSKTAYGYKWRYADA